MSETSKLKSEIELKAELRKIGAETEQFGRKIIVTLKNQIPVETTLIGNNGKKIDLKKFGFEVEHDSTVRTIFISPIAEKEQREL